VVIPLASFGAFMTKVEKTIRQPVVKEGVMIRNSPSGTPEVVILGFIPGDERAFNYNFVFGLSLSMMRLAERHGGRAYATGLYFSPKAGAVLGKERLARLAAYKKKVDPAGILNPGKVLGGKFIGTAVALGSLVEPLIRPFGNAVFTKVGERPVADVRDIPADVAWYAHSC
jgi:FAD/FMN-containing dehydrogenase